jgi:hypothetical protein
LGAAGPGESGNHAAKYELAHPLKW